MKTPTTLTALFILLCYTPVTHAGLGSISADKQPEITTIYASQPNQAALELESLKHGLFSWALIDTLAKTSSETNKENHITTLLDTVAKKVSTTGKQRQNIRIISSGQQLNTPFCATQTTYLLSIGINHYKNNNLLSLKYAVADVHGIAKAFKQNCRNIKHTILIDENATKQNIQQQLRKLLETATAQDRVIIDFSGQSMNISGENYLVPYDAQSADKQQQFVASTLAVKTLNSMIKNSKVGSAVFLLDSCFFRLDQQLTR